MQRSEKKMRHRTILLSIKSKIEREVNNNHVQNGDKLSLNNTTKQTNKKMLFEMSYLAGLWEAPDNERSKKFVVKRSLFF
jgi:hypothetical protein